MYLYLKRTLDVAGATVGLILTAPVLLIVAVLIRCTMGLPILFKQRRPGLREIPFTCLKFRTMTDTRAADSTLLPDEKRLTRFGRLLRRTSLDELPQLWNIFRGDLSFVGPRPLLEAYLPFYTAEERRRHFVRPGLTGWAQVQGRKQLSFEERFALDLVYIEKISFFFDLRILFLTFWSLLFNKAETVIPDTPEIPLDVLRSQQGYVASSTLKLMKHQ